jgi:site-specific DNA recombinase
MGRVRNIVTYHGDRMWRQPYDLEVPIRLARDRGVTITSRAGTYPLDAHEDIFMLGIPANVARLESGNVSRRKLSGYARMPVTAMRRPPAAGAATAPE